MASLHHQRSINDGLPSTSTVESFYRSVQPRRLIERILALHENSNRLIAREDSMSLYVDISEANKYPSRDDLHKRVFNKDRNVSVCD